MDSTGSAPCGDGSSNRVRSATATSEVPAEELFEKLKPFEDLVEQAIEDEER